LSPIMAIATEHPDRISSAYNPQNIVEISFDINDPP
jgi:hypothetical protein